MTVFARNGFPSDGGQAFPGIETPCGGVPGMTLRDYYAGQALVGVLSGNKSSGLIALDAQLAYSLADAMLEQRAKYGE